MIKDYDIDYIYLLRSSKKIQTHCSINLILLVVPVLYLFLFQPFIIFKKVRWVWLYLSSYFCLFIYFFCMGIDNSRCCERNIRKYWFCSFGVWYELVWSVVWEVFNFNIKIGTCVKFSWRFGWGFGMWNWLKVTILGCNL